MLTQTQTDASTCRKQHYLPAFLAEWGQFIFHATKSCSYLFFGRRRLDRADPRIDRDVALVGCHLKACRIWPFAHSSLMDDMVSAYNLNAG
jgi:hypothetical protein